MTSQLDKDGFIFLSGVYPTREIEYCNKELNFTLGEEYIFTKVNSKQDFANDKYYVNNTNSLVNTYSKMQYYKVPVLNIGGNKDTFTDKGLIDIYNADRIFPFLEKYFDIELMQSILRKLTDIEWIHYKTNCKFSHNVQNPAKVHQDNQETCIKFCIYLSDILEVDQGSNIVVYKSHRDINRINNKKNLRYFTGQKGDVLISFQNAFHGRNPNYGSLVAYCTYYFVPKLRHYRNFDNYIYRHKEAQQTSVAH
jgi:hypothetical protein